jgi:hypothetical protein
MLIIFPLLIQGQPTVYSVVEVYTDPDIVDGSEITVVGYYTNTDYNYLIEFYGDFDKDEPYAPHTVLTLTGLIPPADAWNGGFIRVSGIVTFVDIPVPLYPEDSLMAFLDADEITVIFPAYTIPSAPDGNQKRLKKKDDSGGNRSLLNGDCDPCKFAFLLSGGVGWALTGEGWVNYNHAKYWENLAALYKFKVDSLGYCDTNVFVHYYHGIPRDATDIPAARVRAADSAKIDSSFQVIARRVAACNRNGTPATFQKMVTNHGDSNGDICLLGNEVLKPDHLKDLQQMVIDSCCRTLYDEFLQCYGGYSVDEMSTLDTKNKATIYANSNADHQTGYSPHDSVHPYLAAKIASLDDGEAYADAVVSAKLAYDNWLRRGVHRAYHQWVLWSESPPETEEREENINYWKNDSIARLARICKSRNVTIVPFTRYCQWKRVVVPPGGQLVINFSGKSKSCGNSTVYRVNPFTGWLTKVKVWNWNIPGSYRYAEGNSQRVIHGLTSGSTTFWIHNDNDTARLKIESMGSVSLPESPSNAPLYPGSSFGGWDNSYWEFTPMTSPAYFVEMIDQLNIDLNTLPAILGPAHVQQFGFSFMIDPTDELWSDMQLILEINEAFNIDDPLLITSSAGEDFTVALEGPGTYTVPLGDFTDNTYGIINMIPQGDLQIGLDCWGFRSAFDPYAPLITIWFGSSSSDWNDPLNWSSGIPGMNHEVTIMPGSYQPVINSDVIIKKMTIQEGAAVITAPGAYLIVTGN